MTDWIAHYKEVKRRIYDVKPMATSPASQPLVVEPMESENSKNWRKYNEAIDNFILSYKEINTSRKIIRETAERHELTIDELKAKRRTKPIVLARQEAMYLLRKHGLSYPQIAKLTGVTDHTTALHGANAHAKRYGLKL